jgi:hypothetical protein
MDFRNCWVNDQAEIAETWRPHFIRFIEICHADMDDPRKHLGKFLDIEEFLGEKSDADESSDSSQSDEEVGEEVDQSDESENSEAESDFEDDADQFDIDD